MENGKEFGFVYKITNTETGKIYIGQAREYKKKKGISYRYGVKGRWNDHVSSSASSFTPLAQDIRKYGKEKFTIEELEKAELNSLDGLEAKWINDSKSFVPNGYNVMRHSQNKHRDKSNISSFFKDIVTCAILRKIRKEGEYKLVYCYLELEDGTKRRLVFGQETGKSFQEAWEDAVSFVEELEVPYKEDLSNSNDPLEKYSGKLNEFKGKTITKIRIAKFNSLVAVYVTTSEMKSWKEQVRICFGGKTISQEEAHELACMFAEQLPKKADTILIDTLTQSPQQAAASMDETAP